MGLLTAGAKLVLDQINADKDRKQREQLASQANEVSMRNVDSTNATNTEINEQNRAQNAQLKEKDRKNRILDTVLNGVGGVASGAAYGLVKEWAANKFKNNNNKGSGSSSGSKFVDDLRTKTRQERAPAKAKEKELVGEATNKQIKEYPNRARPKKFGDYLVDTAKEWGRELTNPDNWKAASQHATRIVLTAPALSAGAPIPIF